MTALLPPNATTQEIALDETTARLIVPVDIPKLWDAETCPVNLLPWLAWALSIDEWKADWSEAVKRQVIKDSYKIHSHKGTPYSIKVALQALGYDNVIIKEAAYHYYNGTYQHDYVINYGDLSMFPLFDVVLNIGYIPSAEKIAEIRATIERYKNERSVLRNLIFMNILYNDTIIYDGTYMHNGGVL